MITLARFRPAATWCGRVAAWVVLFTAITVVAIAVIVPRTTGSTPYSVLSGSMRPVLEPGDLIVVRPTSVDRIGIGSVITFQLESGDPTTATHRVVAMVYRDGEPMFRTRGDANTAADEAWVRPVQIKGVVWYHAPYVGHLHAALSGSQRQLLVNIAAGCLGAYAMVMLAGAWRDRRRERLEVAS